MVRKTQVASMVRGRVTAVASVLLIICTHRSLADDAPPPGSVRLFNGNDLTGWEAYIWDRRVGQRDTTTSVDRVWKVRDGILVCQGRPTGYLRTTAEYDDYRLQLEWRWPDGTERANSGVLVHVTTPNALGQWPKAVEVQLYTNNAGDFWVIGTTISVPNAGQRVKGRRHLNLTNDSEKPIGEWNKMEVVCRRDEILVYVNDALVNHATNCSETSGAIGLQSEGRPVHFRNIILTPLQ